MAAASAHICAIKTLLALFLWYVNEKQRGKKKDLFGHTTFFQEVFLSREIVGNWTLFQLGPWTGSY